MFHHFHSFFSFTPFKNMGMGQNPIPLVNIKIAGKWMFIPLNMVCIGIDPYPYGLQGMANPLVGLWWEHLFHRSCHFAPTNWWPWRNPRGNLHGTRKETRNSWSQWKMMWVRDAKILHPKRHTIGFTHCKDINGYNLNGLNIQVLSLSFKTPEVFVTGISLAKRLRFECLIDPIVTSVGGYCFNHTFCSARTCLWLEAWPPSPESGRTNETGWEWDVSTRCMKASTCLHHQNIAKTPVLLKVFHLALRHRLVPCLAASFSVGYQEVILLPSAKAPCTRLPK